MTIVFDRYRSNVHLQISWLRQEKVFLIHMDALNAAIHRLHPNMIAPPHPWGVTTVLDCPVSVKDTNSAYILYRAMTYVLGQSDAKQEVCLDNGITTLIIGSKCLSDQTPYYLKINVAEVAFRLREEEFRYLLETLKHTFNFK